MECTDCKRNSVSVYRTTPLGTIPANWVCEECLKKNHKDFIDPSVQEIVDEIKHHNCRCKIVEIPNQLDLFNQKP